MFQGFVDQLMALAEALDNLSLHWQMHILAYTTATPGAVTRGGLVAPMFIHMTSLKPDMLRDRG